MLLWRRHRRRRSLIRPRKVAGGSLPAIVAGVAGGLLAPRFFVAGRRPGIRPEGWWCLRELWLLNLTSNARACARGCIACARACDVVVVLLPIDYLSHVY